MMLLPLYAHPLDDAGAWETVCRAPDGLTVVVNVHDGPGAVPDEVYAVTLARLHAFGVRMLGYVDVDYGSRRSGEVRCDIVGWARYAVGGVFFDRAPSDDRGVAYVARLAREVRGTVALNPGTACSPGYADLADLVCTYEGPWSSYVDMSMERDGPNAAHLVYGVPADELGAATALLSYRAAYGLVTDLDMPLPYAGLPASLRDPASAR